MGVNVGKGTQHEAPPLAPGCFSAQKFTEDRSTLSEGFIISIKLKRELPG